MARKRVESENEEENKTPKCHVSVWSYPSMLGCYAVTLSEMSYSGGGFGIAELNALFDGNAVILGYASKGAERPWYEDGRLYFYVNGLECGVGHEINANLIVARCP